jgi:hypothetical protein
MSTWYNTINLTGDALKKETVKTAKQEEFILSLFKANPDTEISPSRIHTILAKKYKMYPPLTSIRRAMTNLTKKLDLIKTQKLVPGAYHLPEHLWKLNKSKEGYKQTIQTILF